MCDQSPRTGPLCREWLPASLACKVVLVDLDYGSDEVGYQQKVSAISGELIVHISTPLYGYFFETVVIPAEFALEELLDDCGLCTPFEIAVVRDVFNVGPACEIVDVRDASGVGSACETVAVRVVCYMGPNAGGELPYARLSGAPNSTSGWELTTQRDAW
eukprot:5648546-Amphidinium_carterae.1